MKKDRMKYEIMRKYVYCEFVDEVTAWALSQWITHKTRAKNGKPLHLNFPDSLEKYIAFLMG